MSRQSRTKIPHMILLHGLNAGGWLVVWNSSFLGKRAETIECVIVSLVVHFPLHYLRRLHSSPVVVRLLFVLYSLQYYLNGMRRICVIVFSFTLDCVYNEPTIQLMPLKCRRDTHATLTLLLLWVQPKYIWTIAIPPLSQRLYLISSNC